MDDAPTPHQPDPPDPPDPPSLDRLAALSLDDLENRLCCLAARIAAAECEFLELLAEFDARQGWGASGMKSSAHWLSWRTGMRLGAARERLRVARSLRSLPLVREAFAAGRLSYCKVRALSRVATPPTEPDLVDLALGATGAQLERIVRAWRTCLQAEGSASSHIRRGWGRREEDDGSVVFTLRVAPEDAAIVDAAVEAARYGVVDGEGRPVETPEESVLAAAVGHEAGDHGAPTRRAGADAVLLIVESFLATGPRGAPGDSTHVLIHADLKALDEAAGAASAAAERLVGTAVEQRSRVGAPAGCRTESGATLSASTVLRMMCTSTSQVMVHAADGRPLDLGRSQRHASKRQRRALRTRDGSCRFPGCTRRRRLIPHHVTWWSRGGPTDMDNLLLLCPSHHRAVHELGYVVVALGRGRFTFHRPDGSALADAGAMRADPHPLTAASVTETTIVPTWGAGRLDLDHVVGGLAANTLARAGHRLGDIPYPDLDPALRSAARWAGPQPAPPPWTAVPAA